MLQCTAAFFPTAINPTSNFNVFCERKCAVRGGGVEAMETREPCRYDADLPTLSPDIFRIARQSSISLFLPGNRISQTLL